MKVLWIVNCPFPETAKELSLSSPLSQGWVLDICHRLNDLGEVTLCVVSTGEVGELKHLSLYGIEHYVIPRPGRFHKKSFYAAYIKKIFEAFYPDIIHIFGTENDLGTAVINTYPEIKVLLTIQGLMDTISKEYYGGVRFREMLKYRTMRENLRLGGMLFAKIRLNRQRKTERETLQRITHVTGRTLWDYSVMKRINPKIKYHRCNFNLREQFYDAPKWTLDKSVRHTIYTGYADYPLKGLHVLLLALEIVKQSYPDVKLYVPGIPGDDTGELIVNTGYKKLIRDRIEKSKIKSNVVFCGPLSADKVIDRMLKSHIVVLPSAIEGASATVCEGMYLGLPCICAFRGGMTQLLRDGHSGFYYDYPEYGYLAERIMQLFEDDDLCNRFSKNVIEDASIRHDRQKNPEEYLQVYHEIINEKREEI